MENPTDAQNPTDVQVSTDASDFGSADRLLVRFDSGFPLALPNHPRACALVALLGQPKNILRHGGALGARNVELRWGYTLYATLTLPWPESRRIVRVEAPLGAFLAATRIAVAESEARGREVKAAEAALAEARRRLDAALSAEEHAHRRHRAAIAATQIASPTDENRHYHGARRCGID